MEGTAKKSVDVVVGVNSPCGEIVSFLLPPEYIAISGILGSKIISPSTFFKELSSSSIIQSPILPPSAFIDPDIIALTAVMLPVESTEKLGVPSPTFSGMDNDPPSNEPPDIRDPLTVPAKKADPCSLILKF